MTKLVDCRIGRAGMRAAAAGLAVAGLVAWSASASLAARPERSLAGIYIGRPATQVLNRYGNPTRVDTGQFTPQDQTQQGGAAPGMTGLPSATSFGLPSMPGAPGSMPGMPGSEMMPPSPAAGGGNLAGALGGLASSLFGGQAQTPGMATPGAGMPATPGTPQVPAAVVTKYVYDYPSGTTLVFTIGHKGLVEQIDAFAPWPWSPARTARGIGVGSTYKKVVALYGYPDSQRTNSDGTLVMDYTEKAHCAFTLLMGKVVGVSVALVQ